MELPILRGISPFVRCVKIDRTEGIAGEWLNFDHVFTYIEKGKAVFILNGVRYEASEGDVILMPPLLKHLIRAVPGMTLVRYIAHFDLYEDEERRRLPTIGITDERLPDVPPRERSLERLPPLVRIRAADRDRLGRRFRRLLELYREEGDGPIRQLGMKAIVIELIALYLRSLDEAATGGVEAKGWMAIERSIAYIRAHLADPGLSNARIAAGVGFSPGYMSHAVQGAARHDDPPVRYSGPDRTGEAAHPGKRHDAHGDRRADRVCEHPSLQPRLSQNDGRPAQPIRNG